MTTMVPQCVSCQRVLKDGDQPTILSGGLVCKDCVAKNFQSAQGEVQRDPCSCDDDNTPIGVRIQCRGCGGWRC